MRLLKRLDVFLLKAFLQLFAGTFFVCLFVFMMQFTWRYTDELIGKGLSYEVLAKFFWYMGLTLVPMSLPLAILLSSLITFGNMGERLELLSMKAAGIPLVRILAPLLSAVFVIGCASFVFQNNIGPEATKKLSALVWSMKRKSPELEIPEKQFYSAIPGYNIYVEEKDKETGLLYNMVIYTNSGNFEDVQIVLADSARLQSTADKQHLQLTLFSGERFRNMDAQSAGRMRVSVPYMRETFTNEIDLIPFDGGFDLMSADLFGHNAATKNLRNIGVGIDSLKNRIDSTGHAIYDMQLRAAMKREPSRKDADSTILAAAKLSAEPFDTTYQRMPDDTKQAALRGARRNVQQLQAEYDFRSLISEDDNRTLNIHYVEWHKKFTLSLACFAFFFIGAPLGAIIRKGGLGVPVIVSVTIFIFYYIINVSGEKMAKSGQWYIPFGAWLSSMVLCPVGAFLTIKSNNDSIVFNVEGYKMFFMRLLGLRPSRKLDKKEIVIDDPSFPSLRRELQELSNKCEAYAQGHHLLRLPSYVDMFFRTEGDEELTALNNELEALVERLHNVQDNRVIGLTNTLPILETEQHLHPSLDRRLNITCGILLPLGLLLYIRTWRLRLRLQRDMGKIRDVAGHITNRLNKLEKENE
ncbi:MAG: LptF/LptG family permease [Prevotellaceae bacterium]|nr:LptF/LptG family permease [Prevotellaceae bacterium]